MISLIGPARRARRGLAVLLVLAACTEASAQSGENVAVVINGNSAISQRIGDYYAKTRGVPAENVIRIRTSLEETIERQAYNATIEEPISTAIGQRSLHDRILYIVLTKGVPLRIAGTSGSNGTAGSASIESCQTAFGKRAACSARRAGLVSTRCTSPWNPARSKTRRASAASVPRPGPSSA